MSFVIVKPNLIFIRGAAFEEYWIVDWMLRTVEIYRREPDRLRLSETLRDGEAIKSPLLPAFACAVSSLFLIPPMRQTQS